jgi:hypothetical protein
MKNKPGDCPRCPGEHLHAAQDEALRTNKKTPPEKTKNEKNRKTKKEEEEETLDDAPP